ncbi:MAG: Ldh family oxidoreductase [Pseudomonadota bacterium]
MLANLATIVGIETASGNGMTERVSVEAARALVSDVLVRCNTGRVQAEAVARALVEADLVGQAGHGLRRLPSYAGQAASGKVDGHAVPEIKRVRGATLSIHAHYGFAYPAIDAAVERLPEIAQANGVAAAGIRASHHAGVTGLPVERLAREGFVALMFANTPAAIAPWNGGRALYGTNPVAFAAPVPWAEPLVIDLSLSKVARGKLMAAEQRGEAIPEGWALDAEGRPTTDPSTGLKGTMLPLGDAKGAVLALMVELLAAALTGSNFGFEATSFFEPDGAAPGTGQVLLAIDPGGLGAQGLARIGVLAAAIEGQAEARLPGRRRQQLRAKLTAEGIPVDPSLMREIEAIGT